MTYYVKSIFLSIQGEGLRSGSLSVFCRFSGCNLWSGLEKDRSTATCDFCDTDFVGQDGLGGGKYSTSSVLADAIYSAWKPIRNRRDEKFVIFTGGEPLLQLDDQLISAMKKRGFKVALETNGTILAPDGIDWLCVSPKYKAKFIQRQGDELKIVYPQSGLNPANYKDLDFSHFFLQPKYGSRLDTNTEQVLQYCGQHPQWKVSLQTHKLFAIA
jgi:7-carboxy-7-deazaguanine synthase (Cx14CxxC type)